MTLPLLGEFSVVTLSAVPVVAKETARFVTSVFSGTWIVTL